MPPDRKCTSTYFPSSRLSVESFFSAHVSRFLLLQRSFDGHFDGDGGAVTYNSKGHFGSRRSSGNGACELVGVLNLLSVE